MRNGKVEDEAIELVRGHARRHMRGEHVEHLGGQAAGLSHAGEGGGAVQLDLPGLAARRVQLVDKGHGMVIGDKDALKAGHRFRRRLDAI